MRSSKALKNIIVALVYEILLILFGLVVPKLIIATYGSEVNGLTSTITQILQIVSLLQAGAAGASIFQMYKPVAEKDYYQVSRVLAASRKYFCKIGIIFLIIVAAILPFVGLGVKSELAVWEKSLAFLILGLNGSFYFFFTSWFDILFASHQQRYFMSLAGIVEKVVYYGLIFLIVFLKLHFAWMYVAVLFCTVIKLVLLYIVYCKSFKPLLVPIENDRDFKIKNRGYLFLNQLAAQAVDGFPTVIITSIAGLSCASVYAVYNLVQNMIKMVVNTLQHSISEVFGNLVVSEKDERIRDVFDLLEFLFFVMAVILCCCAGFLFMPFVYLYTEGNTYDVSYMYPLLATVIVAYDVVFCMYLPYSLLTNVYGLFKETYLQAVICSIISIAAAVGFGLIHWTLVLVGPVIYYVSSIVYRLAVARKKIAWFRLKGFARRMATLILVVGVYLFASNGFYANGYSTSWFSWLVHAVACGLSVLCVVGLYALLFERKATKGLVQYAKRLLKRKMNKTKESV